MATDPSTSPLWARYPVIGRIWSALRERPQLTVAGILVGGGIFALSSQVPALAGALFGAGATLLGTWLTAFNDRRTAIEEKSRRQSEARQYLAPELHRSILRVLYIHERANVNFGAASTAAEIRPNDLKEDFAPHWPTLYPNAPQVHQLAEGDATALIRFYDSLHTLDEFVKEWWGREGQQEVNIFIVIRNTAGESLKLALSCVGQFGLEQLYPPRAAGIATLTSRIEQTLSMADKSTEQHIARFNAKTAQSASAAARRPR
jgi:hypothetical protein